MPLATLVEYIDWSPFFMTWELKGKYPKIFTDPVVGESARKLYDDAREVLNKIVSGGLLQARGVYGFWPANSVQDDIVVYADESRQREVARFHTLRQQWRAQGTDRIRRLGGLYCSQDLGTGRLPGRVCRDDRHRLR